MKKTYHEGSNVKKLCIANITHAFTSLFYAHAVVFYVIILRHINRPYDDVIKLCSCSLNNSIILHRYQ